MPALTTPTPAFTQALSTLCRQHGYDEFVTASFEPTTGRVLIAAGPAPAQLTPAMQAIFEGCHALRSTYQDSARPLDLDALEADSEEEETELPDDGYDLD